MCCLSCWHCVAHRFKPFLPQRRVSRVFAPPLRRTYRQSANSQSRNTSESFAPSSTHIPVLREEVLQLFKTSCLTTFVDGTIGSGGHSSSVITGHPELELFLGIDVDSAAHEVAQRRLYALKQALNRDCSLQFTEVNYSSIKYAVQNAWGDRNANGILLDLGVSSMQVDTASRGFSFSKDGPLDMRMGRFVVGSAEQIVNTWPEVELEKIFREYGEERHARLYAARIAHARENAPIRTTQQLTAALGAVRARAKGSFKGQGSRIHPATRVFQALRIAVNEELRHLQAAIPACIDCLAPEGRLAVISFHSLEDRIVKRAFLRAAGKHTEDEAGSSIHLPDQCLPRLGSVLTRKPIVPSQAEQAANPRSRSAKLRIFERA